MIWWPFTCDILLYLSSPFSVSVQPLFSFSLCFYVFFYYLSHFLPQRKIIDSPAWMNVDIVVAMETLFIPPEMIQLRSGLGVGHWPPRGQLGHSLHKEAQVVLQGVILFYNVRPYRYKMCKRSFCNNAVSETRENSLTPRFQLLILWSSF